MRRLVLLAIAGLLVGVVVNTMIAWACALWSPLGLPTIQTVETPERGEGACLWINEVGGIGCEYRWVTEVGGRPGPNELVTYEPAYLIEEAGWPLRTWCSRSRAVSGFREERWTPMHAGLAPSGLQFSVDPVERAVPLRPKVPALLAMSLPFAAWPLGRIARGVHRARRNWCAICGYAAAPLPICPECGTPTRGRDGAVSVPPT